MRGCVGGTESWEESSTSTVVGHGRRFDRAFIGIVHVAIS